MAEKLLQIQSLQKRCEEKEQEIREEERNIRDKLREERENKETSQQNHLQSKLLWREKVANAQKKLKTTLVGDTDKKE